MKKTLIIAGVVLLVLIGIPVALIGSAFVGASPIVDGKQLPGGATIVKDGFCIATVVPIGGHDVALIDAGNDKDGKALLAGLGRLGYAPTDVKAIFLTHGHPDHIAGVHLFPNVQVYALAQEVDLLAGRAEAKSPIAKMMPHQGPQVRVNHPMQDGETVTLGPTTFQAFAVPGHTAGSAAYLVAGALYLGDSASGNKDGTMRPAPWVFSDDTAQNHASLKALVQRLTPMKDSVKVLVPAHSGTLDGLGPLQKLAESL